MSFLQEKLQQLNNFRIDDGILEVWERVLPDGDWEGRTATIKDLEDFLTSTLQEFADKIRLEKKEAVSFMRRTELSEHQLIEAIAEGDVYNQAIADLEAIKVSLLKGASSKEI